MQFEGLDELSLQGQQLLTADDAVHADSQFNTWVEHVSGWLSERFPNSGLAAEWGSQGSSTLVRERSSHNDRFHCVQFRGIVEGRLRWLGDLRSKVSHRDNMQALYELAGPRKPTETKSTKLLAAAREYVNAQRIAALKRLPTTQFDVAKLVRMCGELNTCFAHDCHLAMILLTRAIIDHIPPVFGSKNFAEVASNYAGGRSFKNAMARLDTTSRNLADSYLHTQIRKRESLPNITQVDFSNDLDVLLAEVERVLK